MRNQNLKHVFMYDGVVFILWVKLYDNKELKNFRKFEAK